MSRWHLLLDRPGLLRRTALASLVANVGIVITGGVVRLTGSGLGCPTWPRCDKNSLVVTSELGYHGLIEFGNRSLISVVGGLAVACALLALFQLPRRRDRLTWAGLVLAGIAGQAAIGGATVHSVLNPWVVSAHFMVSMAVIAAAYQFWVLTAPATAPVVLGAPGGPSQGVQEARIARGADAAGDEPGGAVQRAVGPRLRALCWLLVGVAAAVLAVGTVVTGSGPHAGDATARRTGLDPATVAQLHADLVMLLIGLSVGLLIFASAALRRAAVILVAVELAQGAIGFVQYFTHLPVLLVGLHMAGACAVWLAVLGVRTAARATEPAVIPAAQEQPAPDRSTPAVASRAPAGR